MTRRRSSGPSHHRRFCCPAGSSGTTAASDALPASRPLPGSPPVIGRDASDAHPQPPGRVGPPQFPPPPSERSAPSTPGGSSGLHIQALHPFHGLHPEGRGSAPPPPDKPGTLTTRQASLRRYGPLSRSPNMGFRRWAPTRPVTRPSRQPATGPPGSYPDGTHTRRQRRAYVRIRGQIIDHLQTAGHTPVVVELRGGGPGVMVRRWRASGLPRWSVVWCAARVGGEVALDGDGELGEVACSR